MCKDSGSQGGSGKEGSFPIPSGLDPSELSDEERTTEFYKTVSVEKERERIARDFFKAKLDAEKKSSRNQGKKL